MSLTIQGLLIAVLSLLFPVEEVELLAHSVVQVIANVGVVVGLIMSWYGRYRQGNISVFGFRK